tara:strand:+ start:291 stop:632 length:342 start_codon:yes stop_codon:yes gene_type:complete
MIDTDKYEGHTPAPWNIRDDIVILGGHRGFDYIAQVGFDEDYNDIPQIRKNARLIADAPKLLAEVKRLREERDKMRELLLRGVKLMKSASKTTDEGNDYFAESFEDAVMEVIE